MSSLSLLLLPRFTVFGFPVSSSPCPLLLCLSISGNAPFLFHEHRIANPVPILIASRLLHSPKGEVCHSSRFRYQLLSDTCMTERHTLTLLAGVAGRQIESSQVSFFDVAEGGFDIIPCT